ncbi:MAG TPA: tetratricopeptide repeat protein, partial [Pyrinomonadaceae bacterium]
MRFFIPPRRFFHALCCGALLVCTPGAAARTGAAQKAKTRGGAEPRGAAQGAGEAASLLARALELLRAGKYAEAEPFVRRAAAADGGNADAHALLGVILDQRGLAREAEGEYRAAVRLNPKAVAA